MTPRRTVRRLAEVLAGLAGILLVTGAPVSARDNIELRATIDGHDLARSSANRPVPLQDDRPAVMNVKVINGSGSAILVRSVRVQGRVIGLTMFSYEARVDRQVAPGATDEVTYEIDLVDLSRQAVGFIPARIQLLDVHRRVLSSQPFDSDVQGSPRSVYGLFGTVIAAITVVLFVSALGRLVAHRLPANRWKRGTRFGVVGLGAGLTITFTLSAFGILFPSPGLWVTLLAVGGIGTFAFGYATPGPLDGREERDDDQRADDASVRVP